MAENPLLPNAELRALRSWTKRATALETKRSQTPSKELTGSAYSSRAALLAGTLLQLCPGDLLVPEPGDNSAAALLHPQKGSTAGPLVSVLQAPSPQAQLLLGAGLAAALKRSGADRLVLACTHPGLPDTSWAEALTWAHTEELPLVLAVADPSGQDAFRSKPSSEPGTLAWTSIQKLASKLKLPVLSVDGEDAVAVYRVMQESVLRARSGGGPAVLWAMLPTPKQLSSARPASALPLGRLEHYLRSRKVSF